MSEELDDLARARATGSMSRRRALRLLLGASSTAVVGGTIGQQLHRSARPARPQLVTAGAVGGVSAADAPARVAARTATDACPPPKHRRALRDVDDCPNQRVPKLNYTPTTNGCGPDGIGAWLVPDYYAGTSFTPACDSHDRCYGTCNSNKATCDQALADDMKAICRESYSRYNPMRYECMSRGDIYKAAVADEIAGHIGQDAYNAGQLEGCDCCKDFPKECVRCSCNKKLYQDPGQCLDECEVGLGCFTAICEPVPAGWCVDQ